MQFQSYSSIGVISIESTPGDTFGNASPGVAFRKLHPEDRGDASYVDSWYSGCYTVPMTMAKQAGLHQSHWWTTSQHFCQSVFLCCFRTRILIVNSWPHTHHNGQNGNMDAGQAFCQFVWYLCEVSITLNFEETILRYWNYYWAHLCICTVGSYASLSVCLSVRYWTKIQTRQKVTRQKVTRQKVICQLHWLRVNTLAGGLTSTSSCFILLNAASGKCNIIYVHWAKAKHTCRWPHTFTFCLYGTV